MGNKLKILILNSYPYIGGAEKFIVGLAIGLKEEGWDVFLGLRKGSSFIREALNYNINVQPLPMKADFDPETERQLCNLHKHLDFRIIFSTDERSSRLGGLFARTHLGIIHIARLRTVWEPHKIEKATRRYRYRIGYSLFYDLIITNSQAAKYDMINNFNISLNKIHVIYNGINLPHVYKYPFYPGRFRKELELPDYAFLISVIGRISARKNQIEAIEIFESIFKKTTQAFLVLVGEPMETEYYHSLIQKRNDSPFKHRIFILGNRNDMAQILVDSDLILSTSVAEGLPNAMIEAGFFEKPVVGRDINGNKEIIFNGINGYLLPEKANVQEFAEAILRIYRNPQLAVRMGRNAQQIVQEKFSYEKMVETYHSIFKKYLLRQKISIQNVT